MKKLLPLFLISSIIYFSSFSITDNEPDRKPKDTTDQYQFIDTVKLTANYNKLITLLEQKAKKNKSKN